MPKIVHQGGSAGETLCVHTVGDEGAGLLLLLLAKRQFMRIFCGQNNCDDFIIIYFLAKQLCLLYAFILSGRRCTCFWNNAFSFFHFPLYFNISVWICRWTIWIERYTCTEDVAEFRFRVFDFFPAIFPYGFRKNFFGEINNVEIK